MSDMMSALRASTIRQYQSGWLKFQRFVVSSGVAVMSPSVPLDFATSLFHSPVRPSPATVANALAAIRDPLWFGFGVVVDPRSWKMLQSSFFLQRPRPVRSSSLWSLPKVLNLFESRRFLVDPSPLDCLKRALFLIALASGHRVSQLAALVRGPAFLRFFPGDAGVSLAPFPGFLAKNERDRHRLAPGFVRAWSGGGIPHALCPVAALRAYLRVVGGPSDALWVFPSSGTPLRADAVSRVLTKVIVEADPGASPRAHQIRSYSSSLAFFRTFDLEGVAAAGQWASPSVFVSRYLNPLLADTPCVVMGGVPPSHPPGDPGDGGLGSV